MGCGWRRVTTHEEFVGLGLAVLKAKEASHRTAKPIGTSRNVNSFGPWGVALGRQLALVIVLLGDEVPRDICVFMPPEF